MESKNMQDRLGWVIKEEYYLKNITAVYENFLGFYKLSAYITHYKRYRVRIWLDWKRCSCFFKILYVTDLETVLGQVEEYVMNNYVNISALPRFVKILKELEIPYTTTFSFINMATLNVDVRKDNIAELIKEYQDLLNNEWKMLMPSKGIQKYTKQDGLENTKLQ